jgi:hypothetical protein
LNLDRDLHVAQLSQTAILVGPNPAADDIVERMTKALEYVQQLEQAGKVTEADLRMNVCI